MATAVKFIPQPVLHPATARLAAWPTWNADPAIEDLFSALRDIKAVSDRLTELHHARPDVGADSIRGELGAVTGIYKPDYDGPVSYRWQVSANGGACASIWEKLTERRDEWIDAKLQAEGFSHYAWSDAKHERRDALADEAVTVAAAWGSFCQAVAS